MTNYKVNPTNNYNYELHHYKNFAFFDDLSLHNKILFFSDNDKFNYLCKYVKNLLQLFQEEKNIEFFKDLPLCSLGYVDNELILFDEEHNKFNYDEIKTDAMEILQMIKVKVEDVWDDISFLQ